MLDGHYDLVMLDVMLPQIDGFEVLRRLRQRTAAPVIMLTPRVAEQDRISGLEGGSDDYRLKPFTTGELLARIRAVLQRAQQQMPDQPRNVSSVSRTLHAARS